jgi:hypothetical protein
MSTPIRMSTGAKLVAAREESHARYRGNPHFFPQIDCFQLFLPGFQNSRNKQRSLFQEYQQANLVFLIG